MADLAPRDDIESLALTALSAPGVSAAFARGHPIQEIGLLRPDFLFYGFSGEVFTYSRSVKFDQLPDYGAVRRSSASLAERLGYPDSGPLN